MKGFFVKNGLFSYLLCALLLLAILQGPGVFAEPSEKNTRGATESTPSLAQYFSWINNTNEGSNEEQTLINLDFFEWLHDEYGMILDIYAFDAGNIDGPRYYGSTDTEKFKNQFPNGFKPIYDKAKSFGCRLGVWLGPDGFGDTPEQEQARIDMLVKLCRDYEFMLFKVDAVCTQLRTEKQDAFARQMTECRKYSPDLILLNHRLNLGKAESHATTFLWGGDEAYIDVHMANWQQTGTHNRVQAISRGLVPDLKRLTEDHGVCISSCLDYWDDDLILHAFNRSLILAPEIYANPWFLRDDEYPKLARIYNLHRRYRDILTKGMVLPEEQYGPKAVSRGDDSRRLITLRNLTWEPVKYKVSLDDSIGLKGKKKVSLYQFHPTEKFLGRKAWGQSIEVEVMPFRSCLLLATTEAVPEVIVKGCDYEVVRDTPGKDVIVNVIGYPGTKAKITLNAAGKRYKHARLDGKKTDALVKGKSIDISFAGEKMTQPWHRKLGDLKECAVPKDAEALYEATCFSADSDALEFRALRRSGPTNIPQVQKARDAFVNQWMVKERGIDPAYLFDNNPETVYTYKTFRRHILEKNIRIDFGKPIHIDTLNILVADLSKESKDPRSKRKQPKPIIPEKYIAEVSQDMKTWTPAEITITESKVKISIAGDKKVRYLRTNGVPKKATDIKGYYRNNALTSKNWRHSYLFDRLANRPAVKAFSLIFKLDQYVEGSYICVPLEGKHGVEGAYAALRVGDTYIGPPRRATSYQSNVWEYPVSSRDSHYTYFIPVTKDLIGMPLEVVVLAFDKANLEFTPSAWITANPMPMVKKQLVLTGVASEAGSTSKSLSKKASAVRFDPVVQNIEGWVVHVDPQMLDGEHGQAGAAALKMLASHLQRIAILLPEEQLNKMRKLEIWIENHHPTLGNMQYHPDIGWLKSHGCDPRLAKKVHIPRAKNLLSRHQMIKHPAVVLHELAHSYHDQYFGFNDPHITKVYDKAMAAGLYDKVLLYNGSRVRHYGATDPMEYFAEGTEAYFYRNDFYPFVAAELKEHDKALYDLMVEIWGPLK